MIFFSSSYSPRMLVLCSYRCFLSTASILMGIIPAVTPTATSDTVRKVQDTVRALSWLIS